MTVHEQIAIIQEFKHLYTEDEYYQLLKEWRVEYEKYLLDLVKHKKD
jgi:hypothetical protein